MPEKSPESNRENLSEKQKEILESVGIESIEEVEDILGGDRRKSEECGKGK